MSSERLIEGNKLTRMISPLMFPEEDGFEAVVINPNLHYPFHMNDFGSFVIDAPHRIITGYEKIASYTSRDKFYYRLYEGTTQGITLNRAELVNKFKEWKDQGGVVVYEVYKEYDPDPALYDHLREIYNSKEDTTVIPETINTGEHPIDEFLERIYGV